MNLQRELPLPKAAGQNRTASCAAQERPRHGAATPDSRPSISMLQNRVGALAVQISAFERDCGVRHAPGPLLEQYEALLRASADAKSALRCAVADKHGEWNMEIAAIYGC